MILLAAWCAMRFGELAELRVKDVDFKRNVIKVRRAVVLVRGKTTVGEIAATDEHDLLSLGRRMTISVPKSDAGLRDVNIPPHMVPFIKAHIREYCIGPDSLLFPAASDPLKHLRTSTLFKVYYPARNKAGRPDLRFHDLRHTGAVLYAQTGATLAELMQRLGHSTSGAAMRYQHAAEDRRQGLADALSEMAARAEISDDERNMPEV